MLFTPWALFMMMTLFMLLFTLRALLTFRYVVFHAASIAHVYNVVDDDVVNVHIERVVHKDCPKQFRGIATLAPTWPQLPQTLVTNGLQIALLLIQLEHN